ncbi:glucose dehydrogenase [Apiospora rasikravindrae]|uniref:Glucose dehydrogenase n=1 Tax=Apiospora rasikravindrae TaxID=990691 RepID=A0ABR1SPI8_9PEZI
MDSSEGWDHIVVGGGLAGCVVASRLKEYQPSARILVIEAGPDVSHNKEILQFQSLQFLGGQFDWAYKTLPQKHCDGREVDIPAGRALGGGSIINGCAWLRGSRADFDSWADLVGDRRWSYDGQLPYFKKTEKWYNDELADQHGHDGKFDIESPVSTNRLYPLAGITEQAWLSPSPGNDMNAGTNLGIGQLNENRRDGARQVAPLVYSLEDVTVLRDTMVGSILLSKEGADDEPKATGVRLADGTEIHGKQVIVSAGAYRAPQILMHSGLGPKEVLEKQGIETVLDASEVGQNFTDHVMMRMNWELKDPAQGYAIDFQKPNPLFSEPQFAKGAPASYVASAAVPRDGLEAAIAKDEGGKADPEHPLLKREFAMMETMVLYLAVPPLTPDGLHISSFLMAMKPTSRGTVTIASKDPADPPLLDPNYLATEVDKYVWRHSLRQAAKLMTGDTTVLGRDVVAGETPFGGFEPLTTDVSDEDLDKRVRGQGTSTYHGAGSCSMGSVVDTDLRFKGVQNLRVVDASAIPIAIGAHIQAAVYALAEQAAVIISQG